jgi:hypothetical protein
MSMRVHTLHLADRVGNDPTTHRLTNDRSTAELPVNSEDESASSTLGRGDRGRTCIDRTYEARAQPLCYATWSWMRDLSPPLRFTKPLRRHLRLSSKKNLKQVFVYGERFRVDWLLYQLSYRAALRPPLDGFEPPTR